MNASLGVYARRRIKQPRTMFYWQLTVTATQYHRTITHFRFMTYFFSLSPQ